MTRTTAWLVTAALLVAAWFVALVTPESDAAERPFTIEAALGEQATGRNISATVTDVRLARAAADANGWRAEGLWLVVDLDVAAVIEARRALFGGVTLTVGDLTFRASERPESLLRTPLTTGVPLGGSIAFELPASVLDEPAELRLSINEDARSDSQIVLPIDLAALPVEDDAALEPTEWAQR